MRVELDRAVFTQAQPPASAITAVNELLKHFDNGRHLWVVDEESFDDIERYLKRHHPTLPVYREVAATAAVRELAWTGTTQRGPVLRIGTDDLEDHAADLGRCVALVLENIPNDKHFLLTVVRAFRAARIQEAIDRRWLEFRNGGGSGSVPAVAEEEARGFRRTIRVVAVFDSDALTPSHVGPNWPKAKMLNDQGIPAFVLMRREAENYAPDRVLVECGDRNEAAEKVKHLARLAPHQRGHYDMKKGFTKGEKPVQRGFFDGIDPQTRRVLHPGFGDTVLKRMFELREELREADFEDMDADAAEDLRRLLALIESLI